MKNHFRFRQRNTSRRIIHGIIVNHEFEWIEVRIKQLIEYVDVFVICESNITTGGDSKDTRFFNAFKQNGFLQEFSDKILYVGMNTLPQEYIDDGWLAEMYLRSYWSNAALRRIANLKDDDLFLNFDADEIPSREVRELNVFFIRIHFIVVKYRHWLF